ncbi:MAG: hypothetical protein H0V73_11450, partial [Chloroflexi bacterium]|nr:hypothetical protein [Chloroflexota bacterium]
MASGSTTKTSGKGSRVAAPADGTSVGSAIAMTPAAALARHLEWLDFALGAATAEETWRRDRLAKATKRNKVKREERLAEVRAEIAELGALIAGLRDLQTRATPTTRRTRAASSRKTTTRKATTRKTTAATTPTPRGTGTRGRPRKAISATTATTATPRTATAAPAIDPATPATPARTTTGSTRRARK